MRNNPLLNQSISNKKGVTLIELLVVLVISVIVVGGIYKVFIAQTRAYTVQDQVAEVQQDVRGAMEIMLRDIRMAGYQSNTFDNPIISTSPIVIPLNSTGITVNYEYKLPDGSIPEGQLYTVTYALTGGSLIRTFSADGVQKDQSDLLDNVTNLSFTYGIDADANGIIDGIVGGLIPNAAFQTAAFVNGLGTARVLAIQITLTANPAPADPDVTKMVSPRKLTSVVTLRNMFCKRFQAYGG